jgi:hypothetical protein
MRTRLTCRESEASYLEKLNEGIAKGTSWERVTDLIQLENSRKSLLSQVKRGSRPRDVANELESKTIRPSVPGGSDLARMKEILLALKREGEKAPGAGGF